MRKTQKGTVLLPVLIVILLVGAVGYFAYQGSSSSRTEIVSDKNIPTQGLARNPTVTEPISPTPTKVFLPDATSLEFELPDNIDPFDLKRMTIEIVHVSKFDNETGKYIQYELTNVPATEYSIRNTYDVYGESPPFTEDQKKAVFSMHDLFVGVRDDLGWLGSGAGDGPWGGSEWVEGYQGNNVRVIYSTDLSRGVSANDDLTLDCPCTDVRIFTITDIVPYK